MLQYLVLHITSEKDRANDNNVSMAQPTTVADAIAAEICNVYK